VRVLGIDPGTRVLGYGVVEQRGTALRALDHGTLSPGGQIPLSERLALIYSGLSALFEAHRPEAVAVEGVFSHRNARSALILGHARGVALLCAARAGAPVFEYAPAEVKRAVGASGAAEKEQVLRLVRGYLGLEEIKKADAADALALAICHLNRSRFQARLQAAKEGGT
jgi:crossover junction endodeoxyribonuclease RuvC